MWICTVSHITLLTDTMVCWRDKGITLATSHFIISAQDIKLFTYITHCIYSDVLSRIRQAWLKIFGKLWHRQEDWPGALEPTDKTSRLRLSFHTPHRLHDMGVLFCRCYKRTAGLHVWCWCTSRLYFITFRSVFRLGCLCACIYGRVEDSLKQWVLVCNC